jgi:hypothetical protein
MSAETHNRPLRAAFALPKISRPFSFLIKLSGPATGRRMLLNDEIVPAMSYGNKWDKAVVHVHPAERRLSPNPVVWAGRFSSNAALLVAMQTAGGGRAERLVHRFMCRHLAECGQRTRVAANSLICILRSARSRRLRVGTTDQNRKIVQPKLGDPEFSLKEGHGSRRRTKACIT